MKKGFLALLAPILTPIVLATAALSVAVGGTTLVVVQRQTQDQIRESNIIRVLNTMYLRKSLLVKGEIPFTVKEMNTKLEINRTQITNNRGSYIESNTTGKDFFVASSIPTGGYYCIDTKGANSKITKIPDTTKTDCAGVQAGANPVTVTNVDYKVGVDYHATGDNFDKSSFLTEYNIPAVRNLVKSQLQSMANDGAKVISTRIWLVDTGVAPDPFGRKWAWNFPPTKQQQDNLRQYAQDVASITASDGSKLNLDITIFRLWAANYQEGSAKTTLGNKKLSVAEFSNLTTITYKNIVDSVSDIVRSDGKKVIDTVYFDGEVMTNPTNTADDGAKKNTQWFFKTFYPPFVDYAKSKGVKPSVYFNADLTENYIFDDKYVDSAYPVLNGRRSMFWIYRTLRFMKDNNLPIPERIDFSYYPKPIKYSYEATAKKVFDDMDAIVDSLGLPRNYAVAETLYPVSDAKRKELGESLLKQSNRLKQTTFWTTPDGGGDGINIGFPFKIKDYLPGTTTSTTTSTPVPNLAAADCIATNLDTWNSCKVQLSNGIIKKVRIDALIDCKTSCAVSLENRKDIEIFGSLPTYGFIRTADKTKELINIFGGQNIKISNLTVDDGDPIKACDYKHDAVDSIPCKAIINGNKITNTTVDKVTIKGAQGIAVNFAGTTNSSINNSTITGARVFGIRASEIWGIRNTGLKMTNNTIKDSWTNAIIINYADKTEISGNILINNHWNPIFPTCGDGNKIQTGLLCPGGQLALDNFTVDTKITNNIIKDANQRLKYAPFGGTAGGIELAGSIEKLIIENNTISNHIGSGIGVDPGITTTPGPDQNIIRNNTFEKNGLNIWQDSFKGLKFTFSNNTLK